MRYIFIIMLFGIYNNLSSQVKLTQIESDTILYRIPVAHRTIAGQPGKYFMKYMGLEPLMDSLDLKGTKIDSMTFASDTLKLYTNDGIFKVKILASGGTLPTLTNGSVVFSNGTTMTEDNSNFFWNNSTKRLGIGTNSPLSSLYTAGGTGLGIGNYVSGDAISISQTAITGGTSGSALRVTNWNAVNNGQTAFDFSGIPTAGSFVNGMSFALNFAGTHQSIFSNSNGKVNLRIESGANDPVLNFNSGGDWGVGIDRSNSSFNIQPNSVLSTGITAGLFMKSTGLFGFNTSNPAYAIDLQSFANPTINLNHTWGVGNYGEIRFSASGASSYIRSKVVGDGTNGIDLFASTGLAFSVLGSNRIRASSLDTDLSAPSTSGTVKLTVTDGNGDFSNIGTTGLSITGGNLVAVDQSITNEGYQGVTAGSGTSSVIQGYNSAGTATGTGTTINAEGSISISETTSANGGQITLAGDYGAFAFGVVGSTTVIPLNGGGVAQIQPGTGITATNSGGTVTISNNAPYTYMNQIAGTTALTTTDTKIALSGDAASNGDALTTNYDNTNDEIDIAVTGTYQIGFSCNCKSNTAARAVIFSMKNNVTSTLVGFVKSYYFTNTDEYCETNFEYPVALTSGARLSLYAKTGGSTTSITDCNISMYARRVK